MRDRRLDITLPMEQAKRIMESPNQLVMITDENGDWTGITINKAEIKGTDHDFDEERDHFVRMSPKLPEPIFQKVDISKYVPDIVKKNKNGSNTTSK